MARQPTSVLVVEDEDTTRLLICQYFAEAGYTIYEADSAEQAETILADKTIDLMLSDIQLPGDDGLSLIRKIRSSSDMGIILITKKSEALERIIGLELGADAYIVKPFNIREVLAYAKNILRRVKQVGRTTQEEEKVTTISFDNITLYPNERELSFDSDTERERLTRDEFFLLMAFLNSPKTVLSRDALLDRIHGADWISTDRTVDVLVGRLRKKLRDNPAEPRLITTIYGEGYIFKAGVRK